MTAWVLIAVVLAAVVAAVVVRVAQKNGAGRKAGSLHTRGRGSGKVWHSWRGDTGAGLIVTRDNGMGYIALVKPVNGRFSFSLRPASELQRAELIMGGQVVDNIPRKWNGDLVEEGQWPVSADGDGTELIPGPIGIRVFLEPTAPDGYVFIISDGPAPAQGEVMQTTFSWSCRLTAMMAGNDFLDDRSDRILLSNRLRLQRMRMRLDNMKHRLADYPE